MKGMLTKMKKEKVVTAKTSNSVGRYLILSVIMLFIGAGGLYLLIYFFPEPFVKTITEEVVNKNVTVTDTGIADAVDKVYDAVVVVKTYINKELYATGTGFVYKKDGNKAYILTNNHVIDSGDAVYAVFTDGSIVETKIEGKDSYSDTAVLSIDSSKALAIATMGSSENSRLGDTVFTVGAPINADTYSGTVTRGILSGKNRLVSVSSSNSSRADMMMSVLQTDAAINSGNSGGPLLNANGEVIGMNSLKLSSGSSTSTATIEGMGFAIPIETALKYATKLEKGEAIERPSLGVSMLNVSDFNYPTLSSLGVSSGVYIQTVVSGSPAEKGGIKNGDIIVSADDKEVTNLAYLRYLLYNHTVGDTMKIKVYRKGEYKELTITLDQKAS